MTVMNLDKPKASAKPELLFNRPASVSHWFEGGVCASDHAVFSLNRILFSGAEQASDAIRVSPHDADATP